MLCAVLKYAGIGKDYTALFLKVYQTMIGGVLLITSDKEIPIPKWLSHKKEPTKTFNSALLTLLYDGFMAADQDHDKSMENSMLASHQCCTPSVHAIILEKQ